MDQQTISGLTGATQVMGTLASAKGSLESARAISDAGAAQETSLRFQATQLRQNAGQVEASAQRVSEDKIRQAKLMASRALAVAGASGGGVSDSTVQNLIAQITGEGKLASLTALYEGETSAAGMRRQAAVTEYESASVRSASKYSSAATKYKAFGTVLAGAQALGGMFPASQRAVKTQKASPIEERKWG